MARFERIHDVVSLIMALQAPGPGLTIDEIMERYGVARRTAERMRDTVGRLFPDLTFHMGDDGRRYWKLPSEHVNGALRPQAVEIDALRDAVHDAEKAERTPQAARLRALYARLQPLRDERDV